DMFPRSSRGDSRLEMGAAWCADIHDVQAGVLEESSVIGVDLATPDEIGNLIGVFGVRRVNGYNLRPFDVPNRTRMERRNQPAADDPEPRLAHVPLHWSVEFCPKRGSDPFDHVSPKGGHQSR